MVKSVLLYNLFIFPHKLITWLIPEQYHILNNTVACSRLSVSGHYQKKWLSNGQVLVEEGTRSMEQANAGATVLHCHVVMHGSYFLSLQEFQGCIVIFSSLLRSRHIPAKKTTLH